MKKASWILLTLAGLAVTVLSLVSAAHAYNRRDDYGIAGVFGLTLVGLVLDASRLKSRQG
jgi:hypothetical protein